MACAVRHLGPVAQAGGVLQATAAWGDNLAGDAKLKVGSPIRVEIVLTEDSLSTQEGYTVVKLDPAALDRDSPYGTLATDDGTGLSATPDVSAPLVYDSEASLTSRAQTLRAGEDPASAEVNATGKVVYGYNLRVPATGDYTISYTFPNVDVNESTREVANTKTLEERRARSPSPWVLAAAVAAAVAASRP